MKIRHETKRPASRGWETGRSLDCITETGMLARQICYQRAQDESNKKTALADTLSLFVFGLARTEWTIPEATATAFRDRDGNGLIFGSLCGFFYLPPRSLLTGLHAVKAGKDQPTGPPHTPSKSVLVLRGQKCFQPADLVLIPGVRRTLGEEWIILGTSLWPCGGAGRKPCSAVSACFFTCNGGNRA